MAGNRTGRSFGNRAKPIHSARVAPRAHFVFLSSSHKREDVFPTGCLVRSLIVFESPLLFCSVQLSQIIYASISRRAIPVQGKIREPLKGDRFLAIFENRGAVSGAIE